MSAGSDRPNWEFIGVSTLIALVVLALLSLAFCGRPPKPPVDNSEDDPPPRDRLLGMVRFAVPTGILEGAYWVYLDRQIVASGSRTLPRIAVANYGNSAVSDFRDSKGPLFQANAERFTYLRNDARSQLFETTESQKIGKGGYDVQLVVASRDEGCVPLAHTRPRSIRIEAGTEVEIELTPPLSLAVPRAASAAQVALSYYETDPQAWVEQVQSRLFSDAKGFENHPVGQALLQLQGVLAVAPPGSGTTFVELPSEYGGSRQVDARQVQLMVDGLRRCYEFVLSSSDRNFGQSGRVASAFSQLDFQINAHNKRIEGLNEIARKLATAARQK
jgi:hypothetical protein